MDKAAQTRAENDYLKRRNAILSDSLNDWRNKAKELEADRARLEWMAERSNLAEIIWYKDGSVAIDWDDANGQPNRTDQFPSLAEAIDAAMQPLPPCEEA